MKRTEANTCDFNNLRGERCKLVAYYWRIYPSYRLLYPRPCRCCFHHKHAYDYRLTVSSDAPDRTAEYEADGNRLIFIDDETPYARLFAEILGIEVEEEGWRYTPRHVWKQIELVREDISP